MGTLTEERMKVCQNHPEKQEIFKLEKLLIEAGRPYYFNFWDAIRPTPFDKEGGDPEKDIDWDNYNFMIELSNPAGFICIQVFFNTDGDPKLLQLTERKSRNETETHLRLSAEQAMEIIEKFLKTAR